MNDLVAKNTVLIIDDEVTNIQIASDILEAENLEIMVAKNGNDGIKRARQGHPDLILLDIRMPEIDGYETCHQLKDDPICSDIPIIFMTGLTELEDKLKAFAVGGVDYITKPFREAELIARVSVHLQLRNLARELEDKNSRLAGALDTGNIVNVAIGILMERNKLDRKAAFEIIRTKARSQRRKVSEVAKQFLDGFENTN